MEILFYLGMIVGMLFGFILTILAEWVWERTNKRQQSKERKV